MNKSGDYINNLSGKMAYKSYRPMPLPPNPHLILDEDILNKLNKANKVLATLNAESKFIPNNKLFISMYLRKEAVLSSQIEGTQCTMDDIFDPSIDANKNLDVGDVLSYLKASDFALKRLKELPICNRLLKEVHFELMNGVRGEDKNPGEFRNSQNWIGPSGCSLNEARYIPPNVEDMNKAMNDLEKYLNNSDDIDPLIKTALIHYQFETIHPFLDGNGRIGRLLILLFLIEQEVINEPIIYISYFLKKNQIEYYDRMSEVRKSGNYEQWVSFFLEAVIAAGNDTLQSIEQLTSLHDKNIDLIKEKIKANENTLKVFSYLENQPIIDIRKCADDLNISFNTVSKIINQFIDLNILEIRNNVKRNRTFIYKDYLAILRKDT